MIGLIDDNTMDEFNERLEKVLMDEEDAESLIEDIEEAMRDVKIELEGLTPRENTSAARMRSYKYMLTEMKHTAESMRV